MVLSSHQPNFIPYPGFFYKIYKSDIFVISDDVWYSKSSAHNWNIIYTSDGARKITVPVYAHHDTRLCDVLVADPRTSLPKVARTLRESYSKSPHFDDGNGIINIIERNSDCDVVPMVDLNLEIIMHILEKLGIRTEMVSAARDLHITGHKDERILQICRQTGADTYFSGTGAKSYHVEKDYSSSGIRLVYSDYTPVEYSQGNRKFIPNLSMFDYICNEGYSVPEEWK